MDTYLSLTFIHLKSTIRFLFRFVQGYAYTTNNKTDQVIWKECTYFNFNLMTFKIKLSKNEL